jgi:DNA polymerase-3 subunit alpha
MVNLRVFSNFSLGESILKPSRIVKLAVENQQKTVAMLDRMNMFGALEFSTYAIKNKIKPLIGCLLKIKDYGYVPVYIKNHEGYGAISKLLTKFYMNQEEYISMEDLIHNKNIIVLWGGDECNFLDEKDAEMKLIFLKEVFEKNFYIEIQNTLHKNMFLNLAMKLHIPIVYTHSTFFEKGSFEAYYTFTCILNGKIYSQEDLNNHSKKHGYFYSNEEIKTYGIYEEGIQNALLIAERCNFALCSKKPMIPQFVEEDSEKILRELVKEKLEIRLQKIDKSQHHIYYERVEKELNVLESKGFCNYFLVTYDFIKRARELNIPVGPGRGSGTGSLVSYALTITNVDPIAFKLIFERFLNPERMSLPDLDIDYDQEKRDLIIDYLVEKYGRENIAHIITFGTLKSRIVVRDVGRTLSIPLKQVDSICKFIPQDQVNPITLQEAVKFDKKLMEMFKLNPQTEKLLNICVQLEGLVRHVSTHAAGVVIYNCFDNTTISDHIPLYRVEGDPMICTQASMKYVEMAGMVKFDFLGLQTLTLLRKTCELVKERTGVHVDIENIHHNDEATFKFICKLNLAGVFQLDSYGMKNVIHDLQPDCLDDIIAIIALFRPGPMGFIPQYISNKKGTTTIEYLLPSLKPILESTYGIIVYQEQVLEIAVKIAGYTLGAADNLRKAMGKKDPKEMQHQESRFLEGAAINKVDEKIARELFRRMSDFAGYGFNKCHAAPYALISYWTAYLKTHYSLEFMSCLMSLDKHDTDKLITYVNDTKKLDIGILPPCVQKSEFNFSIDGNHIRFGLSAIKNMGEGFAQHIVNEREKNGPYETMDNFLHRNINYLNKRQLEYLIYSGAMNSLNESKSLLIQNLASLTKGETTIDKSITLEENPYWEMESLGFFLTSHPMDKEDFSKLNIYTIESVMKLKEEKSFLKMGGIVYDILKKKTHYNNKTYMFVKLLDTTGMFEVTLFSETLDKYLHLINKRIPLVMDVQYEKKFNIIKIIALKVTLFEEYKKSLLTTLYIKSTKDKFSNLQELLTNHVNSHNSNIKHKVILEYQNQQYLLPFLLDITSKLLKSFQLLNIKYRY